MRKNFPGEACVRFFHDKTKTTRNWHAKGKFWVFVPLWWTLRSNPNGVLAHVSSGRLRWRMLRGNARSRRPGGEERRGGRGGEGGGAGWPEVQSLDNALIRNLHLVWFDHIHIMMKWVLVCHEKSPLCQVVSSHDWKCWSNGGGVQIE